MARKRVTRIVVLLVTAVVVVVLGVAAASANGAGPAAIIYLSSTSGGSVAGVDFADEDVLSYNTLTDVWTRVFDGSDVLPAGADVDSVLVETGGDLLLSFQGSVNVAGLGIVDDSDIVRFTPDVGSDGDNTAGTFTTELDGSTVGLTTANEDITAVAHSGDLVVSTLGGFNVPGASGPNLTGADEDLIGLSGGLWDLRFDGSDVSLTSEDLWGAWVDASTGEVYGAALNAFNAGGVTGDGDDVFVFTGTTGPDTSGTFSVVFDGDAHGFGGEQIDGLSVEILAPPPPGSADLSVTKVDDVDPVLPGDTITYTVEVANAGPDAADNVVATDTLPSGVTLIATTGCAQDPAGLTCSLGAIAAGQSASYTISVQVNAGVSGVLTNDVVVAAGTADPNSANNDASEDTLVGLAPEANDDGPDTNSSPGDPFHTASDTALAGLAGGLFGNDVLGDPTATIVSFGGGDAGGDVATNAAGDSVAVADGSITVGADGSFSFVPSAGFAGVFTVDYRLQNVLGQSDATLSIYVGERSVVTGGDKIYLSSTSFGTVAGIDFQDEDILVFDNALNTWELYFDGSDVLPAGADVNGFTIDDDGRLLMTFQNPVSITGLGTVDDSDIVEFVDTTLGEITTGFFQLVLDGTTVGLTTNGEEINALTTYNGDLTVSTSASFNVPTASGNQLGRNEDLIQLDGPSTWSLLFDGSDVDLAAEDLAGASIDAATGDLYATSFNGYSVPGLSGDNNDVIVFSGNFGDPTAGTYSTFFDGDQQGIGDEQLDALLVILNRNDAPEANPDRAATDENTPIIIGPDYTTSISSDGGEIAKIAIDPRTGNYVVLDVVDLLVRVRVYDPVNRRVLHTTSLASPGPAAAIPGGVDVDLRTGNVVVAESRNSTITVLDPTLSSVLDSETVTGLGLIRAVTVDPFTGNIIVGGKDISRIYTPGFASSTDVDHDGLITTGLDVNERNGQIVAVLFADQGSSGPGQIREWGSDGNQIQTLTTGDMDFPADLSIDQLTGDIAVPNFSACCSGLTVFEDSGSMKQIIGGFSGPRGVAYDPLTGNLAVADNGGSLINPNTGALLDSFLDRRSRTVAVQPVSEEILSNSGPQDHHRLVTLDPTTRTRLGIDERFVVDVASDPTTGRIAVIVGQAISSRVLEIYDPTGSTLLHSTSVPGASVAFHPDTGDVAVSLRTGEFRLYDPTLTTVLTTFPFASTDMIGIQPGTGNIVTRFGLGEVRIFDDGGSQVGSIGPFTAVSDLAVDQATGNIAVASRLANAQTEIWDPTGTTMLGSIPVPSVDDDPVGVAFGGTGNLVIGYDVGGSLDVMARGLLANDTDPDGDPLTVTGFDSTSANGAAVSVNPDGSFTYDPTGVPAIEALDAGQTLTDTFTYTIDDGNGETDTATATVFVAGVNDAPNLGNTTAFTVAEGTLNVANFNALDDSDSEGSGLSYALIGIVDDDQLTIDPSTGVLSFNPAPDFENATDTNSDNIYEIIVQVTDSTGLSDSLNVTVTVTDVVDTGSITIIQDTVPDWTTDFSFTGGLGAFSLDDDAAAPSNSGDNTLSNTFEATLLEPRVYTVTQGAVSPFVVTSLDCIGGSTSTDNGTRTATITLAAGDAVTCTFTTEPSSDVSVTLSDSPDPIVAGQTLDYLFGFSTTFPVSDPVLTLDLPAGVTYVGALNGFDSFCSETAPGFVTCDGFNGLWNGATFGIEVTVDAGTVGSISATGSVSFTGVFDPNLANNTATVTTTVTAPDLPPTLVSSTPPEGGIAEPDDDLVLTFSEPVTLVQGAGPAVTIACDAGGSLNLSVTGGPTEFTASPNPTLPPGANCTVTALASRVLDQDGTPDQLTSDAIFSFQVAPRVDLSITKTDSADPVTAGGSLTYTIEVANVGPQPATNVVVTDTLPAGVTFVSTSGCAEDPSGVPTCSLGTVLPGLSKSYTVTVTVDAGTTGTITNSVSVTADETDSNVADNTASEDTTVNPPATPGSAADDAYDSLGNVGLDVPVASGVLDNDTDGSIGTNTVGEVQGSGANVGNPVATSQGGSVTVAANGGFEYTPPVGFEGDDTFTYTIDDDVAGANPNETATVTITVDEVIWFVEGTRPTQGDGTLLSPFNSVGGTGLATAADEAGDVIFIFDRPSEYSEGVTLLANQKLIGEGSTDTLATAGGFLVPAHSRSLPTTTGLAADRPELRPLSGAAVTLATGNRVQGLNLTSNGDTRLVGTNAADVDVLDLTIDVGGPAGIRLTYNGSNTGSVTIDNVSLVGGTTPVGPAPSIGITTEDSANVGVTIDNSTFNPGGPITRGFELVASNTSTMRYQVRDNTLSPANTFGVGALAEDSATMDGEVTGNQITIAAGNAGNSVLVQARDTANHRTRVANNTLGLGSDTGGAVRVAADTIGTGVTARIDATVDNNTITIGQNIGFGRGIQLIDRGGNTVCGNIINNSVTDTSTNTDVGISVVDQDGIPILFEGLAAPVSLGGAIGLLDTPWTANANTTDADAGATFLQGTANPGTCALPVLP